MKKRILFVVNTFSRAGAETALLSLLKVFAENNQYEISLFVLMGQGELALSMPENVRLVNSHYSTKSVLEKSGKPVMIKTVLCALLAHGNLFRLSGYLLENWNAMRKKKKVRGDKLLWRVLSEGAERFNEEYDLAVAFLEGGSAYYVADHVRAKKKAAFIHIDYEKAGYSRNLDRDCYLGFDAVFPIGENVKNKFLGVYPECRNRTFLFPNVVNQEEIRKKAKEPGGFADNYNGIRILTVGRLSPQKSYPVAIETMYLLKQERADVRWYVLGEGPERKKLEHLIADYGLEKDFCLCGSVDNPYPYYAQTALYVHATGFEGKSIAIQEAQTLGCAVIVSESSAEQVQDGEDGIVCELNPQVLKNTILNLINEPRKRAAFGRKAALRKTNCEEQVCLLEELL